MITAIFILVAPFLPLKLFPAYLLALAYMFELRGYELSLAEILGVVLLPIIPALAGKDYVLSLSYFLSLWIAARLTLGDKETLAKILGRRNAFFLSSFSIQLKEKLLVVWWAGGMREAPISYRLARLLSYIVERAKRKALSLALRDQSHLL